jgi:pyruvate-formate lyase-activating enzyme
MPGIDTPVYDFANILFSGRCNARCCFCIGNQVDPSLNQANLRQFPPANLDLFIAQIWENQVRRVVLTGTNTDPQLYAFEAELLEQLRERLAPGTKISLHTNARLTLRKMELLNQYDGATLSIPSFDPATYLRLMGVPHPPDLEQILTHARVPIKVSCLVHPYNASEMESFLRKCIEKGVKRVVLRKPYGEPRPWERLIRLEKMGWKIQGDYRGNAVYRMEDLEITLWDFEQARCSSLNLFSSGHISGDYLLAPLSTRQNPAGLPPPQLQASH